MNPTRKTKFEDLEIAREARLRQNHLLPAAQITEKLTDLLTFVRQLERTEEGKADLERRAQMFGDCMLDPNENERHFYGKLRHWLDGDVTQGSGRSTHQED